MSVVTNQYLFSHTYLAQLQADSSHDEAAAPIAQGLRDWMPFRDTSSLQALIDSWVGPVFDFLEFHHAPAEDASQIQLLYARRGDETPVGLCYVVPPGQDGSAGSPHSLDDTTKGHHPMAQVVLALRARALRWGMLTDGARWRLVDAQALRRYEHYLEIDLDELARSDDPAPLRLFYACFHCSAFIPSPSRGEGREGVGLDRLVTASAQATKAAEDHLKARVSHNEGILAQLCLGLVRADGRARYTETERDGIYRDATYLLYRMLFILHAEARGLLPLDNPAYRAVSLTELVKTAYTYKLRGMPDPQAMTLWDRLKRLCTAIYESDAALSIPAYNGGLFDDADKPHLRDGHIADAYLTQALFDLAYMPATRHSPIDYRDLSVRHLGSLYEGMIEYRLQIAEETLWARRDGKGNVFFLRTGQDSAPRKTDVEIEPGQVYFSQSPGERRATGTYYTPEYIVDYIVRQTVVRGLEERRASLEAKLAGWLEEIAAVQTSEVSETSEVSRMQRTADEELLRFVEEQVLTFQVCDPAMGSGHFLVNAAHQITNFIVETLHLICWGNPAAIRHLPPIETDPVAWRRRVVERCLYGVDLSLMAVELAKLSLWLASVAEGKPLSFLDHHLRQGNSLIGARLEDLAGVLAGTVSTKPSRKERKAREAGQLSMLEHPAFRQHVMAATDLLAQISARVVERVEDVKAQEADYEQVRAELEPYRKLVNLLTACHFGVNIGRKKLTSIVSYLAKDVVADVPEYEQLLSEAQQVAEEQQFFHWPLEFPDILAGFSKFRQDSERGFDCVLGNPPYIFGRDQKFTEADKEYYTTHFSTAEYQLNTYVMFIERGMQICGASKPIGMIVPNTFLINYYFKDTREYFLNFGGFLEITDLGDTVFPDVAVNNVIVLMSSSPYDDPTRIIRQVVDLSQGVVQVSSVSRSDFERTPYHTIVCDPDFLAIQRQFADNVFPLSELADFYNGINTGRDKVFLTKEQLTMEHLPIIRGGDVSRYGLSFGGTYVLYDRKKLKCNTDPAKYYRPKIISRQTGDYLCATFDTENWLTLASTNLILPRETAYAPLYLLAVFNSQLLNYYYQGVVQEVGKTFAQTKIVHLAHLPIRRIALTAPLLERERRTLQACRLYAAGLEAPDSDALLSFVTEQLQPKHTPALSLVESHNADPLNKDFQVQSGDLVEYSDVVHDLLACLAQQMIDLNKERQRLEREANLFRFVARDTPCLRLDKALGGPLGAGEMVGDLSAVRHDIEGLRLSQEENGRWLLEQRAKLRDPESGWRKHQRDRDGKFVRQWLPVYRMPLDEATGRFYHYAFAHLRGFDGAGKFPGGYTRTTLEKLKATKVPKFVPVDLAPLAALEAELADVRRKIQLTDDLIDQIVYKLYGLTEEEIAIVEGRT